MVSQVCAWGLSQSLSDTVSRAFTTPPSLAVGEERLLVRGRGRGRARARGSARGRARVEVNLTSSASKLPAMSSEPKRYEPATSTLAPAAAAARAVSAVMPG